MVILPVYAVFPHKKLQLLERLTREVPVTHDNVTLPFHASNHHYFGFCSAFVEEKITMDSTDSYDL
jgi:hypothetical protein